MTSYPHHDDAVLVPAGLQLPEQLHLRRSLEGNDSWEQTTHSSTGHTAARLDSELRQDYQRLKLRRGSGVAKVAMARKLAVRMYWMLRGPADYAQLVRMQGSPRGTLVGQ